MTESLKISARWGLAADRHIMHPCTVTVCGGRIASVDAHWDPDADHQYDEALLLPAWVNAHTHLEFSDLADPIGRPEMGFADWIRGVIQWRRQGDLDADSAVRAGIAESLAHGVGCLGEIATHAASWERLPNSSLHGVIFRELLGLSESRLAEQLPLAEEFLGRTLRPWRHGLSPHAPYTISPHGLQTIINTFHDNTLPVAMHLAETTEELELLRDQSGPLTELLQDLGAWDASSLPSGTTILDYLQILSTTQRSLVVHGNYLTQEELAFIAAHRDRMAIVFCPRTHGYFGHGTHPLPEALSAGITVAIGTDSRASNPDLNPLEELREVARRFPQIAPLEILQLGTRNGAIALGMQDHLGELQVGRIAKINVFDMQEANPDDVAEELLCGSGKLQETLLF